MNHVKNHMKMNESCEPGHADKRISSFQVYFFYHASHYSFEVSLLRKSYNRMKKMRFTKRMILKRFSRIRDVYRAFVFQQVNGRSVCSSSCTRCCRRRTWAAASGGFSRQTARSSSRPRTKRSSRRCGASAKATAKPWPTRRWRVLCATTRAPERSAKWSASSLTSSMRARWRGFRAHRNSPKPNCSDNRIKILISLNWENAWINTGYL